MSIFKTKVTKKEFVRKGLQFRELGNSRVRTIVDLIYTENHNDNDSENVWIDNFGVHWAEDYLLYKFSKENLIFLGYEKTPSNV